MSDARTPRLHGIINDAVRSGAARLRVMVPGTIESFDPSTGLASVKPSLMETVTNEDETESVESLPVIVNVPVQFPGAGGVRVTFPVAIGDPCVLVFSDRALDKWIDSGAEVDPIDLRRHDLSDAVAFLGVMPKPAAWKGSATQGTFGHDAGPQIQADVAQLQLDGGNAPIACTGDDVTGNTAFLAWVAEVQAAFNGLGVPITPLPGPIIATVTGPARRVKG